MVPCQYIIAGILIILSFVPDILGTEKDGSPPNLILLLLIFLPLVFLVATQDIAVDGWAITMLSKKTIGYTASCELVGMITGHFFGHIVFLTLQSKEFANKWIRSVPQDKGLITFNDFVFFWGIVFVFSTTLILIFKHENDNSVVQPIKSEDVEQKVDVKEVSLSVWETYVVLGRILCLKPMIIMIIVMLTGKIAFAATDGITNLKLVDLGITADKIANVSTFLTPLQLLLPWLLGKWTAGKRPLNTYLWAYPYKIVMDLIHALFVYWTPAFKEENGERPFLYYAIWICISCLQLTLSNCLYLPIISLFVQISDPKVGGTYMTLLNTLNNLGGVWPATLFLSFTDLFTRKNCFAVGTKTITSICNSKLEEERCKAVGNRCEISIDGYYISVGICTLIGLFWYKIFYRKVKYLQKVPKENWLVI